jgi:hypothetical protein
MAGEYPATFTDTTTKTGSAPKTVKLDGTITRVLSQKSVETIESFSQLTTDAINSIQADGYYAAGEVMASTSAWQQHCTYEDPHQLNLPNPLAAGRSWQGTQNCTFTGAIPPPSFTELTTGTIVGAQDTTVGGKTVPVVRINLVGTTSLGSIEHTVILYEPRLGLTVSQSNDVVSPGQHETTTTVLNSLSPTTTKVKIPALGTVSLPEHWATDAKLASSATQTYSSLKGTVALAMRDALTTMAVVTVPATSVPPPTDSNHAVKVGDTGITTSGQKYLITGLTSLAIGGDPGGFRDTTLSNPITGALDGYTRLYFLRISTGLLIIDVETGASSTVFAPMEAALLSLPGSAGDNRASSAYIVAMSAASAADGADAKICPSPQSLDTNAQLTGCAQARYENVLNLVQSLRAINFPPGIQSDVDTLIQAENVLAANLQAIAKSSDVVHDYRDIDDGQRAAAEVKQAEDVVTTDLNLRVPTPTPTSNAI